MSTVIPQTGSTAVVAEAAWEDVAVRGSTVIGYPSCVAVFCPDVYRLWQRSEQKYRVSPLTTAVAGASAIRTCIPQEGSMA